MMNVKRTDQGLKRERWNLLLTVRNTLSPLMDLLAFIWLALTIYELTEGLSPFMENLANTIWIIFALHFFTQLFLAPGKKVYLRHNWPTGISLLLPAFRVFKFFRFFRYLRVVRSLSLVKILSSINRGMRALSKTLTRRVFIYVFCLTIMVIFSGAAGILNFEKDHTTFLRGYGTALWWSAMMVTTMGSDFFPKSAEGRALALFLAVYGFSIFGYVSATVASFLMSRVKHNEEYSATDDELKKLRHDVRELKSMLLDMKKN